MLILLRMNATVRHVIVGAKVLANEMGRLLIWKIHLWGILVDPLVSGKDVLMKALPLLLLLHSTFQLFAMLGLEHAICGELHVHLIKRF